MLIGYFLLVIVVFQEWPEILGPYTQEECMTEKEFLVNRGYEVSGCELLPIPQEDAKLINVPYLP